MDHRAAEDALFGDALACEVSLPASLIPLPARPEAVAQLCEAAETLLTGLAHVEDSHPDEKDQHGPLEVALQRVEAKLDLVMGLLGSILAREESAPSHHLRWSRLGVSVVMPDAVAPGDLRLLRLRPAHWLPQHLELPVRVLATVPEGNGQRLWLAIEPTGGPLEAALERHLFRLHRREIAARQHGRPT